MKTPAAEALQEIVPHPGGTRVLLLGLGNDLLTDDAIGLHIAREIHRRLSEVPGLQIQELSEMGLALLDQMAGFDELILVDAVQTLQAPPGFLHQFEGDQLQVLPTGSPHFLGIGEVLALGQELGLPVPRRVRILAVEVEDALTVGTELTPCLRQALPRLVEQVIETM